MVRVRYKRLENNSLVSKPMQGGTDLYTVTISPSALSFSVVNGDGIVVSQGNATTLTRVKNDVKKTLKALGVNFFDEVRSRV